MTRIKKKNINTMKSLKESLLDSTNEGFFDKMKSKFQKKNNSDSRPNNSGGYNPCKGYDYLEKYMIYDENKAQWVFNKEKYPDEFKKVSPENFEGGPRFQKAASSMDKYTAVLFNAILHAVFDKNIDCRGLLVAMEQFKKYNWG